MLNHYKVFGLGATFDQTVIKLAIVCIGLIMSAFHTKHLFISDIGLLEFSLILNSKYNNQSKKLIKVQVYLS